MAGWRDILLRTWAELGRDHVSMVAAGVAFYGLLALFPGITALLSIWGFLFDAQTVTQQASQLTAAMPGQAAGIIQDQVKQVAQGAGTGVGLAAIAGFAVTFYSATRGVKSLIEALNIIYDETETRSFLRLNLMALALTLGMILMMMATLGLIVVLPAVFAGMGGGSIVQTLISLVRWPILAGVAMVGLAALYRFAPCRSRPHWRWVNWGAAIATVVWLVGSILFSIYVSNFGSYNQTYGSLGAVIVLLMWFWLSAYIVLMGAELDSEIEHQTRRDTTAGGRQPFGERGAHAADTLGKAR